MNVSIYPCVADCNPVGTLPFDDYLRRIKNGHWQDEVLNYQRPSLTKEQKDKLKKQLPCISPHGTFSYRDSKSLIQHSGIINIDIDDKHNDVSLLDIRDVLYADPYLLAGHLSVGQLGLSLYFKIDQTKHAEAFEAIADYLLDKYRLIADASAKDVPRCRIISYDPDTFHNPKATVWTKYKPKPQPKPFNTNYYPKDDDFNFVVKQIVDKGIDLTSNYLEWIRIGFAIATQYGERGREYFHQISRNHTNYNPAQTDKKFDSCLNSGRKVNINTVYFLAKQAGVQIQTTKNYVTHQAVKQGVAPSTPLPELQKPSADPVIDEILIFLAQYKIRTNIINRFVEINGEPINDRIFSSIYIKAIEAIGKSVKKDILRDIIHSDKFPTYDPFIEFIDKYKHRNPTGNFEALCRCITANMLLPIEGQDDEQLVIDYVDVFLKKWLLGIIASWKGSYSVLCPVLIGEQGTQKTRFFRNLLPPELSIYYAESKLDKGKDDEILMAQKAIICDDEFCGKSKKQAGYFKDIISKQIFTLRSPYGRYSEEFRRIAVLCGTSNDPTVINDPTGNRRIIPINVVSIDFDAYEKINKVDLFIELYHEHMANPELFYLTPDEIKYLNQATETNQEVSIEEELIYRLCKKTTIPWMTNTDIKTKLELHTKEYISSKKLGLVLKKLGYKQTMIKRNNYVRKLYDLDFLAG